MNNNGKTAIIAAAIASAVAIPTTIVAVSSNSTSKTDTNNTTVITPKDSETPKYTPTPTPAPEKKTNCVIKGNISYKGEKIYHVPGQKYYDETVINTSKGERWFCTEDEAIAAGWRKSKV